jgi:hypothetical protein
MSKSNPQGLERGPTTDATYSFHHESPAQGGARYCRCETCGAEAVPADPDALAHHEGCPHGDR